MRVGGVVAIATVLSDFGLDSATVLAEAGIDPALLADADNLVGYATRARLLRLCVSKTGCRHFGLLVGQEMNLQSLGIVGLLVRNSADVGEALRSLVKFYRVHARGGAVTELDVAGDVALLIHDVYLRNAEATDQLGDGAVAMMLNIMRTLCGRRFQLIEARFAHRRPADVRPFRRFFGVPLQFDAERNGLLFSADWLRRRVAGADADRRRLIQDEIDALETKYGSDLPEQVRSVLRSALLTGHARADEIAALFSMHSRTLGRRLNTFGTSFQELLDEGGFEIARQMLENTSLEIHQIATSLGYARASPFIRAFRRWSGTTPADWRVTSAGRE